MQFLNYIFFPVHHQICTLTLKKLNNTNNKAIHHYFHCTIFFFFLFLLIDLLIYEGEFFSTTNFHSLNQREIFIFKFNCANVTLGRFLLARKIERIGFSLASLSHSVSQFCVWETLLVPIWTECYGKEEVTQPCPKATNNKIHLWKKVLLRVNKKGKGTKI